MSYYRTAEHRALLAEQCRNRRPWEQSTGPKTEEGKAASSMNAWKGGTRQMLREIAQALREQDDSRRELIDYQPMKLG